MMRRRVLGILVALWIAGCGSEDDPFLLDSLGQAIRNGTREPQIVRLSEGQKLAVGWLFTAGYPEGSFCTGTLIGPRVVATARHCIAEETAQAIGFGVGEQPGAPRAIFGVLTIHAHPLADAALLILDRDAVAAVPGLVPLPFTRAPIDDDLVGSEVEVAGYGETYDPNRTGRYFAVVEVIDVDGEFVRVDGRGRQGLCFGDSGGPVMTSTPAGVVLLGVEHGGESSCVGVDALTRLDVLAAWIDNIAPTAQPGDPVGEPCGAVDYLGTCDDALAVWCDEGRLARRDCASEGLVCGYVDAETGYYCREAGGPADPCGGVPEAGVCEGDVVVRCDAGQVVRDDCGAQSSRCVADSGGAVCERRAPPLTVSPPAVEDSAPPIGSDATRGAKSAKLQTGCAQVGGHPSALAWIGIALFARWRRRR